MQFHLTYPMVNISMSGCCPYTANGKPSEKQTLALYLKILDNQPHSRRRKLILCSSSSKGSRRGFGPRSNSNKGKSDKVKAPSEETDLTSQIRKLTLNPSDLKSNKAPGSITNFDVKSGNIPTDRQFEERLEAVRRSALEKKKEESQEYGIIDYDAPIEPEQRTIGLGTKVGVGVAVVVFGLLFAFGDFLPSVSDSSNNEATVAEKTLTEEEKLTFKTRLQQYEKKLSTSPEDPMALKGAALTLSELGEYDRAALLLEKLSKEKPSDPEVYNLLGEVKYKLKDYEGSVSAYRSAASVIETTNFEVLRGLTNALLAAKKPDEAVQVLLACRDRLDTENSSRNDIQASSSGNSKMEMQTIDPIQVDLLLGKAYSDWGHVSDAVSVYDRLISMHSDDFRGYLAKGILLKAIGKVGDAERMFIQARFFAPENAKALVDRYSRR